MPNKENELLKKIEELKSEIKSLKNRKKYGLVWEDKPEQVVLDCQNKLPILKEVKNREIKTDKNKPVNILIEGDNYHSLSVLNYTHKGKVDVIYIDPPYNTGSENFIYNDNRYNNVKTDDPYRHSKWISLMNKRLKLGRELLSDNGVVFISIDDNEIAQLKLLCDEVFGEKNFIDAIIWKKTENIKMDSRFLSQNKDYVLCYRKSIAIKGFIKEQSNLDRFKLEDKNGRYYLRKLDSLSSSYSRGMDYVIEHQGVKYYAGGSKKEYEKRQKEKIKGKAPTWLWSRSKFEKGLLENEIVFKNNNVYNKVRYDGIAKKPYIDIQSIASQQTAQKELDSLLKGRAFDHPKPVRLIKWLINLVPDRNKKNLILDFFAGSGTTGHAVLELNKEDGGNRKFILCTNNENKIAEDVCYPRVSKVIKGYKNKKGEKVDGLGGNLKYYKTDFVDSEHINKISDDSKIKLTYQAGEMIALRENTLDEVEKNEWWQIFTDGEKQTAIYFKEDKSKLQKLVEKLSKNKKSVLYIFSWGKNEYKNEFLEHKNIRIEDIPEPIIEVYKELNKL